MGYKLCMQKLREEGRSSTESRRYCSKVHSMSKLSQKSQECLRETVERLIQGSAASISGGVILRGRGESEDKKIEAHVTDGEKMEKGKKEESQVSIKMSVESPRLRKPVDVEIHAVGQIQRPNQKWSVEGLIKEELTSKVLVHGDFGFRGEEKESIKTNILAFRSDEQVRFVKESEEYERCIKDEGPKGRKLAHSCKETRHRLASLDRVHAELSLPRTVADNRITELATEAVKMYYLPYLSQRNIERSSRGEHEEYEIEAKVDGGGKTLSVKVSGNGEEVKVENLLPICTKTNLATRVLQKLTGSSSPSSCVIDAGKVKTFDKYEYDYTINDCEHIIFTEASPRPRVTVSAKETPQKQTVIMLVDGHKYEIEIKKESRHSRDNKAIIRVNGEVKQWRSIQQQLQQQQPLQQQQEKLTFDQHSHNVYDDSDSSVTSYADGVYSITSRKYGVTVYADGTRMEVKSLQNILRNRVTGLCGNMNGERTADLMSAQRCIMTKPKLSALSFVLENGQCKGLTTEEKTELRGEEERCTKKVSVPTKVSKVFQVETETRPRPELSHLIEEVKGEICFSKEMIRNCVRSLPKEIKSRQVEFTCRSGAQAEILKRRVESGSLVEELKGYPTSYSQIVYQPEQC